MVRAVQQWNQLLREVVGSPLLEVFQHWSSRKGKKKIRETTKQLIVDVWECTEPNHYAICLGALGAEGRLCQKPAMFSKAMVFSFARRGTLGGQHILYPGVI